MLETELITESAPRRTRAPWPHVVVLDPFTAGLAVARRMARQGARVTMLVDPSDLFVNHARGVRSIVVPFADREAWVEHLRAIARSGEEIVAVPATDRSCELLLDAAPQLAPNVHMFERASQAHRALMSKRSADAIARAAGVCVPWTAVLADVAELAETVARAPWPCVVKPILSHEWRERHGAARTFLVGNAEEALARLSAPLREGLGMLLSQYIPGGDEHVEEAILVRLADGSYPVEFGCQKLRQHPSGFGVTTVGEASSLPRTMNLAKRVLEEADFVGAAGVEAKRHAETGESWFLEVNVRIPGQWGLGDACGVDATRRLVRALVGAENPAQPPMRTGVRIVLPDLDAHEIWPAVLGASVSRRPAVAWRMLQDWRGARSFGLLDPRDPAPALAWLGLLARRRLERAVAAGRGAMPGRRPTRPPG